MSEIRAARLLKLAARPDPAPPAGSLNAVIRNARLHPPQVVPPLGGAAHIDPLLQGAAQAVQHVRQVDSSNQAIMAAVVQLQGAVPVILGRIKDLEDHQKDLRAENVRLHDRTVAAIAEFRSFAAENFNEIKKGITDAAGFFAGGCFGGVKRNLLLRIATCMFLFFCFLFGVIRMVFNFYVKMRKAFITAISVMFAGFGPIAVAIVYNIVSVLVSCIELGWSVLLINTLGSFWPFRMERIGTRTIIALKDLFMYVIHLVMTFFNSLFSPFFDLVEEVTGYDIRKVFTWMNSFMEQVVAVWNYVCSWVFAPVKKLVEGEVLPIDPESIPESAEFVSHMKETLAATTSKAAEVASDTKEALTAAAHTAAAKVSEVASDASDYLAYAKQWSAGAKDRLASATDFAKKKVMDQLGGGLAEEVPKAAKKAASATKTSLFKARPKRGGGIVGFEESFFAFQHTSGVDNQMGFIVVMLAMMSEPEFNNKYLTAYLSNPMVERMTSELYKRIEVMTEFLQTGHMSPSVRMPRLERTLVSGIGMRPTRKHRRARRRRTHKA
jgi:hypothetical protein